MRVGPSVNVPDNMQSYWIAASHNYGDVRY